MMNNLKKLEDHVTGTKFLRARTMICVDFCWKLRRNSVPLRVMPQGAESAAQRRS